MTEIISLHKTYRVLINTSPERLLDVVVIRFPANGTATAGLAAVLSVAAVVSVMTAAVHQECQGEDAPPQDPPQLNLG